MNSLLKFLPALVLACTCSLAHAQQAVTMEEGHMPKKGKPLESRGMISGVMMQDGKMMRIQDGNLTPLTETMTLNNGAKVMPDGSVTMADGKTMMLHNGQHMSLDGTVMDHGMKKGKPKKMTRSM